MFYKSVTPNIVIISAAYLLNAIFGRCAEMTRTGERRQESTGAAKHSLFLENRERMQLGGVTEVCSFSDNAISLRTSCGALAIKGKGLTMSRLDTDTGELSISGEVSSVQYSRDSRKKGSVIEGLFR